MKICYVGNSHLGPLATANRTFNNKIDDYVAGHFIARTYGKTPLKVAGKGDTVSFPQFLLADNPNVKTVVFAEDWDFLMVVGLGFSLIRLIESWRKYQPDVLSDTFGEHLLTSDLSASHDDYVMDDTQATRLISSLSEITDKPIGLVPAPFPAEWASTESSERLSTFHEFISEENREYALSAYQRQVERVESRGVRVFSQPPATITEEMWTKKDYCLGQQGDHDPKGFFARGDFYHMNQDYGAQVTQDIVGQLGLL